MDLEVSYIFLCWGLRQNTVWSGWGQCPSPVHWWRLTSGNGPCSQMGHKKTHLQSSPGAGLPFGQGLVSLLNTLSVNTGASSSGMFWNRSKGKVTTRSPSEQPHCFPSQRKACVNGEPLRPMPPLRLPLVLGVERQNSWSWTHPPTRSPSLHLPLAALQLGTSPAPCWCSASSVIWVLQGWGGTSWQLAHLPGPSCLQRVGSPRTVKTKVKQLWNHQEIAGETKVTNRPN